MSDLVWRLCLSLGVIIETEVDRLQVVRNRALRLFRDSNRYTRTRTEKVHSDNNILTLRTCVKKDTIYKIRRYATIRTLDQYGPNIFTITVIL